MDNKKEALAADFAQLLLIVPLTDNLYYLQAVIEFCPAFFTVV